MSHPAAQRSTWLYTQLLISTAFLIHSSGVSMMLSSACSAHSWSMSAMVSTGTEHGCSSRIASSTHSARELIGQLPVMSIVTAAVVNVFLLYCSRLAMRNQRLPGSPSRFCLRRHAVPIRSGFSGVQVKAPKEGEKVFCEISERSRRRLQRGEKFVGRNWAAQPLDLRAAGRPYNRRRLLMQKRVTLWI